MAQNAWLTVPGGRAVLFETAARGALAGGLAAARRDLLHLSSDAGHA